MSFVWRLVEPAGPTPADGVLGYLIVTDTRGDRIGATHTTLLELEDAQNELKACKARGMDRYAIAEVRIPGEVTRP